MKQPDPGNQSDLLEAIRQGEARAFHWVHREYHRRLIYYAFRTLSSMEAAEDTVSESFYKLFVSRARMKDMGHVREFLYRVTRNAAIDLLRAKDREQSARNELLYLTGDGCYLTGDGCEDKDGLRIIEAEVLDAIYREIENLPTKSRKVFKLYFFEKMTTSEIAGLLKISRQTALNHKSNALERLRTKIPFRKLITVLMIGLSAWHNCKIMKINNF